MCVWWVLSELLLQIRRKRRKEETYMGAKKSSSFSFCGIFKACFSNSKDDYYYSYDDNSRRHFASDEDRGRWVAEPGIDRKASAFIARFYASRVSDSEHQIASWNSNNKPFLCCSSFIKLVLPLITHTSYTWFLPLSLTLSIPANVILTHFHFLLLVLTRGVDPNLL